MPKKKQDLTQLKAAGGRLGKALLAVGRTQVDLALKSGVDEPAISKFLNHGRGLQSDRLLAVLIGAGELNISLEYVVGDRGPAKRTIVVAERASLEQALSSVLERHGLPPVGTKDSGHVPNEGPAPRHRRG